MRARALLAGGLVDVLAADNHGDQRTLAEPWARLVAAGAAEAATLLMQSNPAALLADREPERVEGFEFKVPLLQRLRGWLGEVGE